MQNDDYKLVMSNNLLRSSFRLDAHHQTTNIQSNLRLSESYLKLMMPQFPRKLDYSLKFEHLMFQLTHIH